jgi:putative acetyltransferase
MLIRRETPADVDIIRATTASAFAYRVKPGEPPPEAALIDDLRASDAWLPALSLVAVGRDGDVVGHVVCTRGRIDSAPVLALGPLSVRPDHQRRGVGLALMHTVLGAADALGAPLVALLGDPRYYSRFDFRLGDEFGILPPVPTWRAHFQVRTLTSYVPSLRGTFTYPKPFDRV